MAVAQRVSDLSGQRAAAPLKDRTVIAIEHNFDFRSAHFLRLFQHSSGTAFQHPLWLDAFYRLIAPERGAEKLVLTGRDGRTGQLQLVMPFIRTQANGMTIIETADLGVSDYAAPIYDRAWTIPESIRHDIAKQLPYHDLLRIRPVRADTVQAWRAFIDGDTHSMDFFGGSTALAGPFPEWRSGALDQDFRKPQDASAPRQLKCGATELRLLTESPAIARAIDSIRRIRAGRFEADPIQEKSVLAFYISLAISGGPAGFARTYAIMQGEQAIGHVFGISWKGRFHYLLIGCDFQRQGRHAASLMLHDTMVEDWMQDSASVFHFTLADDLLRQEDAGNKPGEMFIVTRAPTWRGRLARAALDATDHVERMQRGTYTG